MSDVSDIEMGRSGLQLAAEYIIQQDPTIKLKVLNKMDTVGNVQFHTSGLREP